VIYSLKLSGANEMFDHKHYVPVLKTKAGERWALEHLKDVSMKHITPVLEIHPPRKPRRKPGQPAPAPKSVADHVSEVCESIASIWPVDKLFFLDASWLKPTAATIKLVFDCARSNGLLVVPVARPAYGAAVLSALAAVAQTDGRGCMLRCTPDDIASPQSIAFAINRIGQPITSMDFMIDYGDSPMTTLAGDISNLQSLNLWRTLSAASGVFPPSLKQYVQAAWFPVDRTDWLSWETAVLSGKLKRKPAFGDYATRDPQPPGDFGDPDVHLRYTKEKVWYVHQDGKHRAGKGVNIFAICADLVAQPFFDGPQFSKGDEEIAACALRTEHPGGPAQWTQWCLNHHLEFVVQQMQSHNGL
jgi:hypothetical protein